MPAALLVDGGFVVGHVHPDAASVHVDADDVAARSSILGDSHVVMAEALGNRILAADSVPGMTAAE